MSLVLKHGPRRCDPKHQRESSSGLIILPSAERQATLSPNRGYKKKLRGIETNPRHGRSIEILVRPGVFVAVFVAASFGVNRF